MRQRKTLKLDDREYTICELTMRQVWDLVNNEPETGGSDLQRIERFLGYACPDLDREQLLDLAPSELRLLWTVFQEVNADFLGVLAGLGIIDQLKAEVTGLVRDSITLSVPSLPPATAP